MVISYLLNIGYGQISLNFTLCFNCWNSNFLDENIS